MKPSHAMAQWIKPYFNQSQWRDRAGFAPDFPFKSIKYSKLHLNIDTLKRRYVTVLLLYTKMCVNDRD